MSTPVTVDEETRMYVAIIGAGAAGLCCARHLSQHQDVFSFRVFEKSSCVGGTWVYTDQTGIDDTTKLPVHSSMYASLRTNLPKEVMSFPGFPFSQDLPSFVHHTDMLEYLQKYTAHYKIEKFISFFTLIESVIPVECATRCLPENGLCLDQVKWEVTSRHLTTNTSRTELFDAVIVCNGHYFKPYVSEVPGLSRFPGPVIHSHLYRYAESFTNQNVLVIGAGPSGRDIAVDLSSHADHVFLSHHKNPIESLLPNNLYQVLSVTDIFENGEVLFACGERHHINSILLCTGYEYEFPFLDSKCGISVQDHRVSPLYKHIFNTLHPSMGFIGLNFPVLPFPYFNAQVQFLLSVWLGTTKLPSKQEMDQESEERFQKLLKLGLSKRKAHYLGPYQWDYVHELASIGGFAPLDPVTEDLYDEIGEDRLRDLVHYKEANYKRIDRTTWRRI